MLYTRISDFSKDIEKELLKWVMGFFQLETSLRKMRGTQLIQVTGSSLLETSFEKLRSK